MIMFSFFSDYFRGGVSLFQYVVAMEYIQHILHAGDTELSSAF
jgi:hypothetical protein